MGKNHSPTRPAEAAGPPRGPEVRAVGRAGARAPVLGSGAQFLSIPNGEREWRGRCARSPRRARMGQSKIAASRGFLGNVVLKGRALSSTQALDSEPPQGAGLEALVGGREGRKE